MPIGGERSRTSLSRSRTSTPRPRACARRWPQPGTVTFAPGVRPSGRTPGPSTTQVSKSPLR